VYDQEDYPLDEYTLASVFGARRDVATRWFNYHFENFVLFQDMQEIAAKGVTHIRVPLPHWIMGDVAPDEPWIVGDRWKCFVRLLGWCRQLGIQVWPDIHTAPGSQNGFDNSGQQMPYVSCQGWSGNPDHVRRSLQVIRDVVNAVVKEGYVDVVTGFGLLNEPFKDCHRDVYLSFINQGLQIVRSALGDSTSIYVSDMFLAKTFNTRQWTWLGLNAQTAMTFNNTYLDSHYYHVFAEEPRALSPRQHIAYVCQNEYRDTISCCYKDPGRNTEPALGVKRMVGEWSAAYDTLPVAKLKQLMDGIAISGIAPEFDRQIPAERQEFMKRFVEAQMVAYEASSVGTSGAWFYWTLKMEGGAFAEWDFMRGLREGWIPPIPAPNRTSQSLYGTCYDIIFKTADSMNIVNEFPDPATLPANNWQGVDIDDDVVVTHGQSLLVSGPHEPIQPVHHNAANHVFNWILFVTTVVFSAALVRAICRRRPKSDYSRIEDNEAGEHHVSISV
jgi:glucan 1,3-beta-glucosidase